MTLEEITELNMLNECAYECTKQSRWKETTQRYLSNLLLNNIGLQRELLDHTYKVSDTVNFYLNERGRIRYIEAPIVKDRVVQKTFTKNVLIPKLLPYVIYDNYASIKYRGTSFARKRFEIMLRRYMNKNGTDGYILFIDIKKYFENIDHEILKEMVHKRLIGVDKEIIDFIDYIIDTSSHSHKGLNLGSEAPQVLALYYLNPLDTFVKIVKGIKYYGRYMDDIFIIGKSKKELLSLLSEISKVLESLKLSINNKKTNIVKISHGFIFLQIKYNILKSGKIIKRPTHKKIVRERNRLKALKRIYDRGLINEKEAYNCYNSWRGSMIKEHNACFTTITNMDNLYKELFNKPLPKKNKSKMKIFNYLFKEITSI